MTDPLLELAENVQTIKKQMDLFIDMLTRQQKLMEVVANQGKLHWIGGYAYGRTSENDPYILLYPAPKGMVHKVCRVYKEDFHKLPYHVSSINIPKQAQDANPDKGPAKKMGIYHNTPVFTIATVDGKETPLGPEQRFFDTVELTRNLDAELSNVAVTISPETVKALAEEPEGILLSDPIETVSRELGLDKPTQPKYANGKNVPDNPTTLMAYSGYVEQYKQAPQDGSILSTWYRNSDIFVN
jgi:hypothetical protein